MLLKTGTHTDTDSHTLFLQVRKTRNMPWCHALTDSAQTTFCLILHPLSQSSHIYLPLLYKRASHTHTHTHTHTHIHTPAE